MPKKKQGWDETPLGQVAKENKIEEPTTSETKEAKGPQVFENLYHPEDNDEHPNYPANGIWR